MGHRCVRALRLLRTGRANTGIAKTMSGLDAETGDSCMGIFDSDPCRSTHSLRYAVSASGHQTQSAAYGELPRLEYLSLAHGQPCLRSKSSEISTQVMQAPASLNAHLTTPPSPRRFPLPLPIVPSSQPVPLRPLQNPALCFRTRSTTALPGVRVATVHRARTTLASASAFVLLDGQWAGRPSVSCICGSRGAVPGEISDGRRPIMATRTWCR